MNTFALVRHLLFNDVRRLRWLLVAYVACVLLATAAALVFALRSPAWSVMTPLLVFVAGYFLLASAVQADSPYRSDAFWVSRPIQPTALLSAKLVLAALVVVLPVAGLAWTLVHIGFPTEDFAPTLGSAVDTYASWLLLGMALAAVTHDLRSFGNVFLGFLGLLLIGSMLLLRRVASHAGPSETATWLAAALFHMGPLAVLALVYLKRDAVQRARVLGAALLLVWLVVYPYTAPPGNSVVTVVEALPPAEAPKLSLVLDDVGSGDTPMLRYHVSGEAWRDAARLVVTVKSVLVHARDGTTLSVQRVTPLTVPLRDPLPDGATLSDVSANSSSSIYLTPGEMRRLTSGIESIELVGTVEPYAVQVAAILPFTSGAKAQQGGTMFQVDSVQRDPVVSSAVATTVSVRPERQSPLTESLSSRVLPKLVLVDDQMRRGVSIFSQSSASSSGWMILPGLSVLRRWTKVEARWPAADAVSAMAPAKLIWLDWTSLGQAPVRLRAARE